MKNNIDAALEYLNRDYLINVSIIDLIENDMAEILYADSDGVLVRDKITEIPMIQTYDPTLAERLLSGITLDGLPIVAHNDMLAAMVEKKLSTNKSVPCYQAVYRKPDLKIINCDGLEIRLLGEDEADEASQMYGFSKEDAIRHIRLGYVYGGFVGGEIVGMIGMHMQGSMGLLVVKDNFRRKGYAEAMETFLIAKARENGHIPFCQIIEDNVASLSLQRKLGLDISENKLYWMSKR